MRDPFFQSIVDALARPLDPNEFELCVVDLLREDFPGLVPIPGGNDGGMDGAIPDGDDVPLPVVTTTGSDLLRNLVKNLTRYKETHHRRDAVFVTSRKITGDTRRRLEAEAEKLGFVLRQIYGRTAIASRLYRNPKWCRSLLQLTGDPPALSVVPLTSRPVLNTRIIGRTRDFRWLRATTGDRILIGQPGIGKTFLLSRYARVNEGLFVVDEDRGKLANAIREQRPSVLIVDDAHARLPLLATLKHMRGEIHADYTILAVSWHGGRDEVREALGVPQRAIRELSLLTRDQIVRVVHAAGVHGPTGLVHEIVSQAEGRAGLAVSLAHSCIRGDVQMLSNADALRSSLVDSLAQLVGSQARQVLAAFAVGGDRGMTLGSVSEYLKIDIASAHNLISKFAQGGVIKEVDSRRYFASPGEENAPQRYSVSPSALQHGLIRDIFFGQIRLDIGPLLERSIISSATTALVSARLRGASAIDSTFLRKLFPSGIQTPNTTSEGGTNRHQWFEPASLYAYVGREEALWVLEKFPEVLRRVPSVMLDRAPRETIARFLNEAVGDRRELHSTPSHPFRILGDWLRGHQGDLRTSMARRRSLLRAAENWLRAGRDQFVGMYVGCLALCPQIDRQESDAGSGNRFSFSSGSVSHAEIEQTKLIWERFLRLFAGLHIDDWTHVVVLLHEWLYGDTMSPASSAHQDAMLAGARRMISDLVPYAQERPGMLFVLRNYARRADMTSEGQINSEFESIFDDHYDEGGDSSHLRREEAVESIATMWAQQDPESVAKKVEWFVREAKSVNIQPYRMRGMCYELARRVPARLPWVTAFMKERLSSELIEPFVMFAAHIDEPGWAEFVGHQMTNPTMRRISVESALSSNAPAWLQERLIEHEEDLIASLSTRRQPISETFMKVLLTHPSPSVASAAALQEWNVAPRGTVRPCLNDAWKRAAVQIDGERPDHTLIEMFKADPELGLNWLVERLQNVDPYRTASDYVLHGAIDLLSNSQRQTAILSIRDLHPSARSIALLVGDDPSMYEWFLSTNMSRELHLVPLKSKDDEPSVREAHVRLALQAGHSPSAVTDAIYGNSWMWRGPMSKYWARWKIAFEPLTRSDDSAVSRIGQIGLRRAKAARRAALGKEREEAIFGRI